MSTFGSGVFYILSQEFSAPSINLRTSLPWHSAFRHSCLRFLCHDSIFYAGFSIRLVSITVRIQEQNSNQEQNFYNVVRSISEKHNTDTPSQFWRFGPVPSVYFCLTSWYMRMISPLSLCHLYGTLFCFDHQLIGSYFFPSIFFPLNCAKCSNYFVLTQSLHAYFPRFFHVYEYWYYIFHEYLIFS